MKNGWEAIIGMEIHAQLATETKIFCDCEANFSIEQTMSYTLIKKKQSLCPYQPSEKYLK